MSESRLIVIMSKVAKMTFVNVNRKYLFIREYENSGELLKLLIKLYHTPQPPILPIMLDISYNDSLYYSIKFWFNRFTIVIEKFNEYAKYPLYTPKQKSNDNN